jgi:hypothetical protein
VASEIGNAIGEHLADIGTYRRNVCSGGVIADIEIAPGHFRLWISPTAPSRRGYLAGGNGPLVTHNLSTLELYAGWCVLVSRDILRRAARPSREGVFP